jgi:hypothetical protein
LVPLLLRMQTHLQLRCLPSSRSRQPSIVSLCGNNSFHCAKIDVNWGLSFHDIARANSIDGGAMTNPSQVEAARPVSSPPPARRLRFAIAFPQGGTLGLHPQ